MFGSRLQHTFIEQEPDMPWHLQILCIRDRRARRPASLLCKFISPTSDLVFSMLSINFRENWTPKLMSSEQPPHCHFRCFFRFVLSQLHSVRSALEQARVTAHARAAELIAWTNAVSLLPEEECQNIMLRPMIIKENCTHLWTSRNRTKS